MALFVVSLVVRNWFYAIVLRRNTGPQSIVAKEAPNCIAIVGLIGENDAVGLPSHQILGIERVV